MLCRFHKILCLFCLFFLSLSTHAYSDTVVLLLDRQNPQSMFAAGELQSALRSRQHEPIIEDLSALQRHADKTRIVLAVADDKRITTEIPAVIKVVYDITPKPPSTIEYI